MQAVLSADTQVVGLVGKNVFPLVRPMTFPPPAATLQRIAGTPQNSLRGDSGLQYDRVQLDAWGLSLADAQAVADACRKAINAAGHILERESDNFNDSA